MVSKISNTVQALQAHLGQSKVLLPSDPEFSGRQNSFWSRSAQLEPTAIVLPSSSQEVSLVLKALVASRQSFAVRSGGHTNWPGANNIEGGVTIDLSLLNHTVLDDGKETVNIGPGGKWRDVYAELDRHGLAVAGGREGNVGVAGLILGGGNTFFTAKQGFACDNVVEYEVVLANGDTIKASKTSNSDLFYVLKGGGSNFGIVTNFKMVTIPCTRVWGGMSFLPKSTIPAAAQALTKFTSNIAYDNGSNLVCMFTYMPAFREIVVASLFANIDGIERPPIYKDWLALPQMANTIKMTSIKEMAFEYNIPAGHHVLWFTACFHNDASIVAKASELHEDLVGKLMSIDTEGAFTTQCLFQPLPTLFGQRSAQAGGNAMGVDRQQSDGLLWLATAMMRSSEHESLARPFVLEWVQNVKDFAAGKGKVLPWCYLNYADCSQNVLASYGEDNVRKIRDAATRYDPGQVFQNLCPGGFKISGVKF